jgi:2'-5' RNA ligase
MMSGQTDMFTSDTRPHRYVIIINPGFHVNEKVKQFKQLLNEHVGLRREDLHSKAHITLTYVDSPYNADREILDRVKRALKGRSSFDITIRDTGFWDSGTFYLKIDDPKPVQELMAAVDEDLRSIRLRRPEAKIPHITLARKLSKQAMSEIPTEEFAYCATFRCNTVTILKQVLEPAGGFEVLEKLRLG